MVEMKDFHRDFDPVQVGMLILAVLIALALAGAVVAYVGGGLG
jgi:hypothetical protein